MSDPKNDQGRLINETMAFESMCPVCRTPERDGHCERCYQEATRQMPVTLSACSSNANAIAAARVSGHAPSVGGCPREQRRQPLFRVAAPAA